MRIEQHALSLIFAVALLCGVASEASALPSEREVVDGIKVMIEKPLTSEALEAGSAVVAFAEASSKINVLIAPQFWCPVSHSERDTELLAYYIAGATKFDLENQSRKHDRFANVPTAIRTMLFAYRTLVSASPEHSSRFFDRLSTLDRQGRLDEYVARCLANVNPRRS